MDRRTDKKLVELLGIVRAELVGTRPINICELIYEMFMEHHHTYTELTILCLFIETHKPFTLYNFFVREGYWWAINERGKRKRIKWIDKHIERLEALNEMD